MDDWVQSVGDKGRAWIYKSTALDLRIQICIYSLMQFVLIRIEAVKAKWNEAIIRLNKIQEEAWKEGGSGLTSQGAKWCSSFHRTVEVIKYSNVREQINVGHTQHVSWQWLEDKMKFDITNKAEQADSNLRGQGWWETSRRRKAEKAIPTSW